MWLFLVVQHWIRASWLQSLAEEMFALIPLGHRNFISSGCFSAAPFSRGWNHVEGKSRGAKHEKMWKNGGKAGPAGQGKGFA